MSAYRIFTVVRGKVSEGAALDTFHLKGVGIDIPAVIVGEEGRGRSRGVLPVGGTLPKEGERLLAAEIGTTKAGKPKLFGKSAATTEEEILVVFRTPIGYRGGNDHTGDRTGEFREDYWAGKTPVFESFPGKIIAEGQIAQGIAGRMGSGRQLVALMPKGVVFRTGYSGRLYGAPAGHYYLWNGSQLLAATWPEREASDIF